MDLETRSVRLDPDQAHRVFRAVLDAFSRPGRLVQLDPTGELPGPPVAWPALALADIETTVCVHHPDDPEGARRLAAALELVTGAQVSDVVGDGDVVIIVDRVDVGDLSTLRVGDAAAPELGAKLIMRCTSLADSHDAGPGAGTTIWIIGPGAVAGRLVRLGGVDAAVVEQIDRMNAGYPVGTDVLYVADDGGAVAVPRSCRVEIVAEVS